MRNTPVKMDDLSGEIGHEVLVATPGQLAVPRGTGNYIWLKELGVPLGTASSPSVATSTSWPISPLKSSILTGVFLTQKLIRYNIEEL